MSRNHTPTIKMLVAWALDHPGQYRFFAPDRPTSAGALIWVYVVHPPDRHIHHGQTKVEYGPQVDILRVTADEAVKLAHTLDPAPLAHWS